MSAAAPHPMGTDDRSFAAGQAFTLGVKTFWTTQLFPALRAEYEAAGPADDTPEAVAQKLGHRTLYHYFAWLERHLQRMKYSGRYGLVHWHGRDRAALEAALESHAAALDPQLEMPRYYRSVDIHQHPGGVWGDSLAGYVYERGARSTTPLAGQRHQDLHQRLAEKIAALGTPKRLIDLGCGFGKSTRPLAERFPDTAIEAVDLAAPCLRLASRMSADAGLGRIRYVQADARHTAHAPESFDCVTSTMLLHELPPRDIEAAFAEAARVLEPGGWMVHLDFLPQVQPRGDAFAQFIHYGHGRRNNEPFMEPLSRLDVAALLAPLGFTDIAIEPFEESDGALAPDYPHWRFPWTLIRARKSGTNVRPS
jgi:ubiquinone/menaquinone biosynthesis C-methylase UbiE